MLMCYIKKKLEEKINYILSSSINEWHK